MAERGRTRRVECDDRLTLSFVQATTLCSFLSSHLFQRKNSKEFLFLCRGEHAVFTLSFVLFSRNLFGTPELGKRFVDEFGTSRKRGRFGFCESQL